MLNKNKNYVAKVTDLQPHGNGLAVVFGKTIILPGTIPGDEVEFKLIKLTASYGVGKVLRVITHSSKRAEPRCPILKICGGCHLQHLAYEEQLRHKYSLIRGYLDSYPLLKPVALNPVIPAENQFGYRNKAQFAFQKTQWGDIAVGLYSVMSHRVADTVKCAIQDASVNQVLAMVRKWLYKNPQLHVYDEQTGQGELRHIVIRSAASTGEIMVALVVASETFSEARTLVDTVKKVNGVASILLNINAEPGNTVLGQKTMCLFGKETLTDTCDGIEYEFSLHSFTQSDPVMAKKLYQYVVDLIIENQPKSVLDLYCGIGVMTMLIAKKVPQVIGVEMVADAVKNANANAEKNGIKNIDFYLGDVKDVLSDIQMIPDLIVLDPPRKGCDKEVLEYISHSKIKTIIYVSCHPQTLARDLAALVQNNYEITSIQPFDNFAQTAHVESVAVLQLKTA